MHDFDPIVSPYNGHMLHNLSKNYLFICCKQSSSTHICRFLTTAFVTDVLAGSNPMRWAQKKKGSHCWEPIKSVVGDEGCPRAASPPASASGLRPSRAAPENASRFLSSAPCRVRIPLRWAQKRKAPIDGSLSNRWWAMRDVRVRLAPPALASGLRPSRAALENASRFLSFAPCRVRIPCAGPKQKRSPCEDRFQFNGGR